MQATSPAGRRQPGAGNNSHSHTDITEPYTLLTRMRDRKPPEHRGSFRLRSVPSPTPHMTTSQGRACYILKSLNDIPFSPEDFAQHIWHMSMETQVDLKCSLIQSDEGLRANPEAS